MKILKSLLLIVGAILLTALLLRNMGGSEGASNCILTGSDEVAKALQNGAHVIDVRTQSEFNQGHLPGAMLMDVSKSDFIEKIRRLDRNTQYVVYCKTGIRSGRAIQIMQREGFGDLCNIRGGTAQLLRSGYELVH